MRVFCLIEFENSFEIKDRISQCKSQLKGASQLKNELREKFPIIDEPIDFLGTRLSSYSPQLLLRVKRLLAENDVQHRVLDFKKCQDEFCVLEKVFGHDEGIRLLGFLVKYNLNLSPFVYDKTKYHSSEHKEKLKSFTHFSQKDLEVIQMSLDLLPSYVLHKFKEKDFKRIKISRHNNYGNSGIELFNLWESSNIELKVSTVLHELAHNIETDYHHWASWSDELSLSTEWGSLHEENRFISSYSRKSPAEDFAESFSAYILTPDILKKTSKKKYNYLKYHVFNNVEYNIDDCLYKEQKPRNLEIIDDKLSNDKFLIDVKKWCLVEYANHIFYINEMPLLMCIASQMNSFSRFETYSPTILKSIKDNHYYRAFLRSTVEELVIGSNGLNSCLRNERRLFSSQHKISILENREVTKNHCRWLDNALRNRDQVSIEDQRYILKDIMLQRLGLYLKI